MRIATLIILILTLWLNPSLGFAQDRIGFSLIMPSEVTNRYGGNILLDVGEYTTQELPALFAKYDNERTKRALPKTDEPIVVTLITPKNAPESYTEKFRNEVQAAFKKIYPNAKFDFRSSFVDLDQNAEVLLEAKMNVTDPIAEKAIEQTLDDNQQVCENWFQRKCAQFYKFYDKLRSSRSKTKDRSTIHPYNSFIAAGVVAATKLSISLSFTVSMGGLSPVSFSLGAAQGLTAALFGFNATKISQWKTSHRIPLLNEWRIVKWYNEHGSVKSGLINTTQSVGLNYLFRYLAYATEQQVDGKLVETPFTSEFLYNALVKIALPEVLSDVALDEGLRSLELNGKISRQSRDFLIGGISLVDTGMHSLMRMGNAEMATNLNIVNSTLKVLIWLSSKAISAMNTVHKTGGFKNPVLNEALQKYTKPQEKRFVVISDQIKKEAPGKPLPTFGYAGYLFGLHVPAAIYRRAKGQFHVNDRFLINSDQGLSEAWTLSLDTENMEKFNSTDLTETELRNILNLKDSDEDLVELIKNLRLQNFNKDMSPVDICVEALAASSDK